MDCIKFLESAKQRIEMYDARVDVANLWPIKITFEDNETVIITMHDLANDKKYIVECYESHNGTVFSRIFQ